MTFMQLFTNHSWHFLFFIYFSWHFRFATFNGPRLFPTAYLSFKHFPFLVLIIPIIYETWIEFRVTLDSYYSTQTTHS